MCILFAIGLILIFSAPSAGQSAGHRAVRNHGSSMDTWQFQQVIESTTISYQAGGFVISLVGGLGLLGSAYILYKERPSGKET